MGAILAMAMTGAIASGLFKKKPGQEPAKTPLLPQIVSEEVATYAQKQARRRRGMGSTILTGDMTVDPAQIGKKALLGS